MKRKLQKLVIEIVGVEVLCFEKQYEAVTRFFWREMETYERRLKELRDRLNYLSREVERNGKLSSPK